MVHRARLLPRLALVMAIMAVSTAVTGALVWFAVLGAADDVRVGSRGGAGAEAVERGADVPAGWPEALTPPEGSRVISSVANGAGTPEEQLLMVVEATGGGPAVADALRAQLTAAGLTVTSEALTPRGVGSITATGAGWEASVAVSPNPAHPELTMVSWVLRRGPR